MTPTINLKGDMFIHEAPCTFPKRHKIHIIQTMEPRDKEAMTDFATFAFTCVSGELIRCARYWVSCVNYNHVL
jgi:hypothetical protein